MMRKKTIMRWLTLLLCAVLVFSAAGCQGGEEEGEKPSGKKVKLMFEIEEGISGKELSSKYKDNEKQQEAALNNIYEGLKPLMDKFDVTVQIYPNWHYREAGYEGKDPAQPLNRISPELKRTLNFFRRKGIGFYLEIHSSGIRTNQNGELGNLAPAPLHYGDAEKRASLPMDMETVKALKEEYDFYFEGLRMHELIGSHQIGLHDREIDNEEYSHAWVVQEEVVKTIIDTCAEADLHLVWSDHSWNDVERQKDNPNYSVFADWLNYAVETLKPGRLTLNWANNGWPVHQYITDEFLFKGYGGTDFGMSVQDWFWQEMDCSTLRDGQGNVKWYVDADIDCPPELMAAFTLRAIAQGASLVQFEPPQYFFNTYTPRKVNDIATSSVEEQADYSAKIALKRFTEYLLSGGEGVISTDISDYFDTDRERFDANKEADPAKRYYQNTLYALGEEKLTVYDRYNNDLTKWHNQSQNRLREYVLSGEIVSVSRVAVTFSATEEILVAKRESGGVRIEFYNFRSGRIPCKNDFLRDNEKGKVTAVVPQNVISKMAGTTGGDPDELIVLREKGGALTAELYAIGSGESSVTQDVVLSDITAESANLIEGLTETSADGLVNVLEIKNRFAVLSDMTRPKSAGVVSVYGGAGTVKIKGRVSGSAVDIIRQIDGKVTAAAAVDIDGDFKDELAVAVAKDGKTQILFFCGANFELAAERIDMVGELSFLFSLRAGTYVKAF